MKVLFFIHSLAGGGAERVTVTLANAWADRGWPITIVTVADDASDRHTLHPGVQRIALHLATASAGAASALTGNVRRIVALRRILRRQRPDVAIAMMTPANVLLALASTALPVRAIGSERTYPPQFPLGRVWEALRRWSYRRLAAVVSPTTEVSDWMQQHTSARQVGTIPNPVAWPFASQPPAIDPSAIGNRSRHRLLAVGRLGEEKRFAALIEVFATTRPDCPDWELVILGEGPEREALQQRISELGLSDCAFLPGHAGNMSAWYESAALFALTSRFEGFPNVLAEALAHGVPAVSVDCDTGPRDILRDGVDGMLVPASDDRALALALATLMRDETTRKRYAARAGEARERFSVEAVTRQWESLLTDLTA